MGLHFFDFSWFNVYENKTKQKRYDNENDEEENSPIPFIQFKKGILFSMNEWMNECKMTESNENENPKTKKNRMRNTHRDTKTRIDFGFSIGSIDFPLLSFAFVS